MTEEEQPTITQADRDAAVEFAKGLYGKREGEILTKRMVEIFARHFARHRTASMAAQDGLVKALRDMTDHYVRLIDSGDAGSWNPRDEPVVQRALAALSAIKEQHHD